MSRRCNEFLISPKKTRAERGRSQTRKSLLLAAHAPPNSDYLLVGKAKRTPSLEPLEGQRWVMDLRRV